MLRYWLKPDMKNSVFFIIGGAAGIGAEVVRKLAGTDAKVAMCDINRTAGETMAPKPRDCLL